MAFFSGVQGAGSWIERWDNRRPHSHSIKQTMIDNFIREPSQSHANFGYILISMVYEEGSRGESAKCKVRRRFLRETGENCKPEFPK